MQDDWKHGVRTDSAWEHLGLVCHLDLPPALNYYLACYLISLDSPVE